MFLIKIQNRDRNNWIIIGLDLFNSISPSGFLIKGKSAIRKYTAFQVTPYYVEGLPAGQTLRVYSMTGTLVYTTSPNSSKKGEQFAPSGEGSVSFPLPARGIYIVTDGQKTIKVMNWISKTQGRTVAYSPALFLLQRSLTCWLTRENIYQLAVISCQWFFW